MDDWSLKDIVELIDTAEHGVLSCEYVIRESKIDLLRLKLIEDLCGELLKYGDKPSNDYIPQETILKVINKRFGFDEEDSSEPDQSVGHGVE